MLWQTLGSCWIAAMLLGCDFYQDEYGNRKLLPAPPPVTVPYSLSGLPYAIKQGDRLQIVSGDLATLCQLIGIRAPSFGEPCFDDSAQFLNRLVEGRMVQGTVYRHDAHMRAHFRGYVGELDLNLEMIRQGYARYDGTDLLDADLFRQVENEARQARRGIWQYVPEN